MSASSSGSLRRARAALAVGALATAVLAGCGSGEEASDPAPTSAGSTTAVGDGSSDGSSTGAGLPDCTSVWVDGATLPRDYRGCVDASGTTVAAQKHACSLGSPIVEFDDRYYAVAGNRVNDRGDLAHDQQFRSALSACQA